MANTSHALSSSGLSPSSPSPATLHVLTWKCLEPVESPMLEAGELSARDVLHRRPEDFRTTIEDTTWLLHQVSSSGSELQLQLNKNQQKKGAKKKDIHPETPTTARPGGELYSQTKTRRHLTAQGQRAYAHYRLGDFARAIHDYDACIAGEATSALMYYNRGCAFYASGKKERAIQDFTRALKLDCKSMLYIESRALVNKELGRFQEAIQDYAWLETLRRMVKHTRASAAAGSIATPLPSESDPMTGLHGSFSMSFSELQMSLMGADGPVSVSTATSPASTIGIGIGIGNNNSSTMIVTEGLTTEEREKHVMDWMIRFLQLPPQRRTRGDIRDAVHSCRTWSFFRGMDAMMIEQCLEDATFARVEADEVVVEQGQCSESFYLVLDPCAPFVRNISSQAGVSKLRELKKLSQGDAIGTDAYGASFAHGTLRTIRQVVAEAVRATINTGTTVTRRLRNPHGSLHALLTAASLLTLLSGQQNTGPAPTAPPPSSIGGRPDTNATPPTCSLDQLDETFLPPEPASLTSLEPVHCLVLDVDVYREILHEHEERVLEERVLFLRGCRVFQSLDADVLTALAAVSGTRTYDPGTTILRLGDEVMVLYLIKKGVCQVRKTIEVPMAAAAATPGSPTRSHSHTTAGGDGSWVLDNGWMLTNPRLVNNARGHGKGEPMIVEDVNIGILASGQVFGELSVLQPGQCSQVTIHSQTLVEVLVFEQGDLARLNVQYHSGTMNALQDSLLFHNPPQQKILQLQRDLAQWEQEKRHVLHDLALQLPTKARSVLKSGSVRSKFGDNDGGAMSPALSPGQLALRRRNSLSPMPIRPLTTSNSLGVSTPNLLSPVKILPVTRSLPALVQRQRHS